MKSKTLWVIFILVFQCAAKNYDEFLSWLERGGAVINKL